MKLGSLEIRLNTRLEIDEEMGEKTGKKGVIFVALQSNCVRFYLAIPVIQATRQK